MLAQRSGSGLGMQPELASVQGYPNPFVDRITLRMDLKMVSNLSLIVSDAAGRKVATLTSAKKFAVGQHDVVWQPGRDVAPGQYIVTLYSGKTMVTSTRVERH